MCAQARRRFTQVIHMVMHSKAGNTFSCRAGRQRVSVPVLARGGRHPGRGSGLGLDDITPDGGHRMLAARPAAQAARAPRRLPTATLTVIPPAARPRYAQAARAQSPPALPPPAPPRPRAGAGGAGPHRLPGSAADNRPATADARALAPEASLLATAWHPIFRARTPAVLHGSGAGAAALALTAFGPAWPPGNLARLGRTPDHRGRHSRGCRGADPGKDVPAGQNQARPLHV